MLCCPWYANAVVGAERERESEGEKKDVVEAEISAERMS